MDEYKATIDWSDADGVYVAEAPELPGCMAHGATRDEARERIAEAMALWLDTAREFGDPVPTPKGQAANARERLAISAPAPRGGIERQA